MNDRRYGMPEGIQAALSRFLQKLGKPEQVLLTQLWQHWAMVMGPELNALTWPLGHKKGVLIVGGEDAMSVQEISFMSEEILERVNAFMGQAFFTTVRAQLSFDKSPLDITVQHFSQTMQRTRPPNIHKGSPLSGKYLKDMPAHSAVARCYARYIQINSQ